MNGNVIFQAAQRAPVLINRQKELQIIRQAIYQPQASLQIVLIYGAGGMGKSRLVEEVLWRAGNQNIRRQRLRPEMQLEWDWTRDGDVVVGDLIDMNDIRLQNRTDFIHAIYNALVNSQEKDLDFSNYDSAYRVFEARAHIGDLVFLKMLEEQAEREFLKDYRKNASNHRIVLIVDTVEKLYPIGGAKLLLTEELLSEEDLAEYTYIWLLRQIRQHTFPNTTLLLVGRAEEGKGFFEAVRKAAAQNPECQVIEVPEISHFSLEDTRTYFQVLIDAWQSEPPTPQREQILATFRGLLEDEARLKTLWHYTGGQPVRLALYADLIAEDPFLPASLLSRNGSQEQEDLEEVRRSVEAGFVRLLFARPGLRAGILQALVRAPRGLDAEQLHFILASRPDETVQDWLDRHAQDVAITYSQIINEMEELKKLALVKVRPDGRLALQDEVYRIYTRAIAQDETQSAEERKARYKLYHKLREWAKYHREENLKKVREYLEDDERQLPLERPSKALAVDFPALTDDEEEERAKVRAAMQAWRLEELHYALLQDYRREFNAALFEEAQSLWLAHSERDLVLLQAERWQPLLDRAYALEEFGNLEPWESLKRRYESPFVALERIALQDDLTLWIMIFILRRQFQRAIEFATSLERKIQERRDRYNGIDANFLRASWMHTLARHERSLWKNVALIYIGQGVQLVLEEMSKAVKELEALLRYSQEEEVVFPDGSRRGETGFKGHPAEIKVRRLLALYYNYIGYGYATLGATTHAKNAYGRALRIMREVEFPHMEATTRNNLARVLSDRSQARGRRVCLDALELRKQQSLESPLALSYNTLALIDNDHGRPDLAWVEAATAVAYARRSQDQRVLGLALLQLGEALRRIANLRQEFYYLRGDPPEALLRVAANALTEAIKIFTDYEEIPRRLEAWIEQGSLERDRMRFQQDKGRREQYYRSAVSYLKQAADMAKQLQNDRLELDALVNLAWTHYRYPDFGLAEKTAKQAESLVPKDAFIREDFLPDPNRDKIYLYHQLSRLEGLYGRIALERFRKISDDEELRKRIPDKEARHQFIHENVSAQQYLQQAAEHYVKALAYSQLQSPRAHNLRLTYNALYERLVDFNLTELQDFYKYVRQAIEKYHTNKLQTVDLGRLDEFLEQTFGLFEGDEDDG